MIEYGNQRGRRMRQRAEKAGSGSGMESYMAFGEWTADKESMDIRDVSSVDSAVTRVYKCPWCTEWRKFGFIDEGRYYCSFVDKALVEGFNEEPDLGLNSIQPEGNEYCEFVWNGADLGNIEIIPEKSRVMPCDFHIAHLMSCIENHQGSENIVMKGVRKDIPAIYDLDINDIRGKYRKHDFNSI